MALLESRIGANKSNAYCDVAEGLVGVELNGEREEDVSRRAGRLRDRELERACALCVRVHERHAPDQLRVLRVQSVVAVARAHHRRARRRRAARVRRSAWSKEGD